MFGDTKETQGELKDLKEKCEIQEELIKEFEVRIKELLEEISKLRDAEIDIRKEYLRKEEHATALMKVKQQEEIAKAVNTVKDEYAKKEKDLLEANFEKLSGSMTKLHEEGNRNSQYQEKMTLKMMDVISSISSGKKVDSTKLIGAGVADDNNEDSV